MLARSGNAKLTAKRKRNLIRKGTRKTNTIGVFGILAGASCPGKTALCWEKCNMRRLHGHRPNMKRKRERDLMTSRGAGFVSEIVSDLRGMAAKGNLDWFRIHDEGDFYSQRYLDKWFRICRLFPQTRFLAFTKSFHLNFQAKPDNLTVVWSVFPDTDFARIPPGPRAYAGDSVPEGEQVFECAGTCDACLFCWNLPSANRNVRFKLK